MKILYITPFKPSLQSGGEITVFNNINILFILGYKIDYIGPQFDKTIFEKDILNNINCSYFNQISKIDKVLSLFNLSISSYINQIKSILKEKDIQKYDYIFIESTRFGSLIKQMSKINRNIVVNMHNIELNYFKDARNLFWYNLLKYKVYYSEQLSFSYAKTILYLTRYELDKLKDIYSIDSGKQFIWNPVTYKVIDINNMTQKKDSYLLYTANFTYKPNIDSVYILNKVKDINIYIAGKKANILKTKLNSNIKLFEFPSDKQMDNLMKNAKIFLSTVKDGAGMKVKIIEAMAYGLPIIAHKNSLHGYEPCESIVRYKTDEELLNILKNLDILDLEILSNMSIKYFKQIYSYEEVQKRYKGFLNG